MSEFYSIVTNIGTAKIANAEVTSQKLDIVHYAVGDGGGNYYNPTVDQTALRNERWRGTAIVDIDPREPNIILITTSIPHDVGGFDVREIGIFDADGDMVVVGKVAEFYKPVLTEGSTLDGALKTRLIVSNTATVALKNDPNLIHATKYYVDTEIVKISDSLSILRGEVTTHLAQTNPHAETANRTINVGPTRGFKTLQTALDSIKKNLGGATITVYVDAGTYTGVTYIHGFTNGQLVISSALVTSTTVTVAPLAFENCNARIEIKSLTISVPTGDYGVSINSTNRVIFNSVRVLGDNSGTGVNCVSSSVIVQASELSNLGVCVTANANSKVHINGCYGTNNTVAAQAISSFITLEGTQPTATIAKQEVTGGLIRP